jgi:mannosylglycoprotein endo-beta-mannosidase
MRVNARRRKNHVYRLKHNNGWVTDHEAKEEIVFNHFSSTIGHGPPRTSDFNWAGLHFTDPSLEHLGDPFTEEEVRNAINQMPGDKAPGPDGFTGAFFKRCWGIIKDDIMKVVHLFEALHSENFHWLNSANIVLVPKKDGAEEVTDFRPISLIHAIAKIVAKMIANRLAPLMNELVSNAQSAFIKKRSIHDNFLYVKNLATRLHRNKTPALLFKLDIRKAFDSVRWDYIIDLLQRRGFPSRFRNWIVALLFTATSRVLLNGVAGAPMRHGRGLRQGDPLSPLLFVLAIDPLSQILEIASAHGLLHKIRGRGNVLRTSLYADDAAVFVAPLKHDIQNLEAILHSFGEVTGLCTNFQKSSVVPIRCGDVDLDDILQGMPATRASFPLRYLGLPLSVRALKRVDFLHLEDKCVGKLPTWNGKLITTAGRAA